MFINLDLHLLLAELILAVKLGSGLGHQAVIRWSSGGEQAVSKWSLGGHHLALGDARDDIRLLSVLGVELARERHVALLELLRHNNRRARYNNRARQQ